VGVPTAGFRGGLRPRRLNNQRSGIPPRRNHPSLLSQDGAEAAAVETEPDLEARAVVARSPPAAEPREAGVERCADRSRSEPKERLRFPLRFCSFHLGSCGSEQRGHASEPGEQPFIEPPWSQFTSDCRWWWHPPRPNNACGHAAEPGEQPFCAARRRGAGAFSDACCIRAWVEIMGSQTCICCRNVGEYQSVLVMIDPMIFTRPRKIGAEVDEAGTI
jgi:hypothetical protein